MPYGSPRPNYKLPKPSLFQLITASRSFTGTPDVTDLPSDLISQNDEPYMERHFVLGNSARGSQARYHHILASDGQHLHDHPWDFISVIIDGSYIETTPTSEQAYGPGSVLIRKAEDLHRLTINTPVLTFVMVSPARRQWGFQTDDGWTHWTDYLRVAQT